MEILIMQVFVSLALVVGSVLLFLFTAKQRTFDHADRLALLPVTDDEDDIERDEAAALVKGHKEGQGTRS